MLPRRFDTLFAIACRALMPLFRCCCRFRPPCHFRRHFATPLFASCHYAFAAAPRRRQRQRCHAAAERHADLLAMPSRCRLRHDAADAAASVISPHFTPDFRLLPFADAYLLIYSERLFALCVFDTLPCRRDIARRDAYAARRAIFRRRYCC
jgi:hypothetical protein